MPVDSPPLALFGRSGVGPGEFNYPRAALATTDRRLFVIDKAGRVQCLRDTGTPLHEWRMPEISAGKPTGAGFAPDGRLYVADTHYARVMLFDQGGQLLGQFGEWGLGPGQFRLPTDVAVASDGSIFVSEYGGNDRISKFTADHHFVLSFGGQDAGAARLSRPQCLVFAPDGSLWVTDACNHRVCHFNTDGVFLGAFGQLGHALGELRFPYGLDLLSDGTLVVCEYGNNRIQHFDASGRALGTWGRAGREPGQLAYPWAVAVGPGDRIFVVDSGNNRVQVIDGRDAGVWRK